MAEKRRHHYIPQFYLRGFVDPATPPRQTPYLWVWDKHAAAVNRRAPKNLALEMGYYAVEADRGLDYATVENELSQIENRAAFALRRYLGQPIGNRGPIQPDLSTFLAWLAARVPWYRSLVEEDFSRFIERMAFGDEPVPDGDDPTTYLLTHQLTGEEARLPLPETLAAARSGLWRPSLSRFHYVELMRVQAWYFQFRHFPALLWTILDAPPGYAFVTSDRPVVWYVPDKGFADSPAALKHPEVELTVPLSARTALLATAAPLSPGTRVHPNDINIRTIAFAERFVAAPSPGLLPP